MLHEVSWRSMKPLSWCRAWTWLLAATSRARAGSCLVARISRLYGANCPAREHSASCMQSGPRPHAVGSAKEQ